MIDIFTDTHKLISANICDDIDDIYNIKLDKSALSWGSVAPDILPQYKFHRHYQKESINYIANEISKLIFVNRHIDFKNVDPITMKFFSKNLGIISHYLSDFVCLPHAERWTFSTSMVKHIKYEYELDKYAPEHNFKKNIISVENIDIYKDETVRLRTIVKEYIEEVVEEYSKNNSFSNDLDFALSLNVQLSYFVIDTINSYNKNVYEGLAFEF